MARCWSPLPWKRSGADEFKSLQIVLQNFRITSLFVMETDTSIRDDLENQNITFDFHLLKIRVCMPLLEGSVNLKICPPK